MTALSYEIVAVVPAAGIGSRMQADKPKQYLTIQDKTILEHTLDVLLSHSAVSKVILAVAKGDPYLATLTIMQHPKIQVVEGGETRAQSVLNALRAIEKPTQTRVLVHDAARPCLRHAELDKLLDIEDENGAILALSAIDTIKRADLCKQIAETQDRNFIWLAQTPQYFRADLLINALELANQQGFAVTDEASAMELAGFRPHLVEGVSSNIKITRPEDLALAEFYLGKQKK